MLGPNGKPAGAKIPILLFADSILGIHAAPAAKPGAPYWRFDQRASYRLTPPFDFKGADVGEGLLCHQLGRTVRETKISRLSQPIDCAQVGKVPH
jgi:hypothetical protein